MSRHLPSSSYYSADGGIKKSYKSSTVPVHRYPTSTVDTYCLSNDNKQMYNYYEDVNCYLSSNYRNNQNNIHHNNSSSGSGSGNIRCEDNTNSSSTNRTSFNNKNKYRIYPNVENRVYSRNSCDRIYQEIQINNHYHQENQSSLLPLSKLLTTTTTTDRPQSALSSGVTSAIVDGCGGKCQTFENVCYFFLQLVFMMGILIGISLSIAGLVLRKSAARNLQVLVYIGVLLTIVSGLLLGIQLNTRNNVKKRKLAIINAKRTAPIPLENLNLRRQQQQPLMVQVPHTVIEQPGIPWWRRRDMV